MTISTLLGDGPTDLWIDGSHGRMFVRSWFPARDALRPNHAPILLLHESLGCIEQWKDFPSALAQATGRTVVAYDRLGFGRSDRLTAPPAPTFVEDEAAHGFACVLEHLGIERFVVLGHSVGGSMAVHCAARYPEACQAMITMSAVTFVEQRTLSGIRQARAWFADPAQRERLRRYHGERSDWVLSAWIDTWLAPDFATWTLAHALPAVGCPSLAIHGDDDEFGSERHPQLIADHASGQVEQALLSGVGHVPHREQPGQVLERIERFLQRIG
ncbi:MAG TPA: alpha/beta hydrolase [Pseudomonas sp.]|uniref:Alpha/beta hydrolase n=1 Tax=Stutzerimonas stutzeri TaxID=316 RepID=A0ABD4Y223_STUST|nr:alpha/beta hydrolase [Stutzerimonas stutzeri]MDH0688639.1 alpha/beta hydrolase [Stutzerimonas stutzeri]HCA65278.1 alpha/beta hydrolase [Pseudomonas sp.]